MNGTYEPRVFDAANIAQAKRIILTAESSTTEERWTTETPYLAGLIGADLRIGPGSLVLDYGCGIGRLAKELIARHGCRVIGVDISPSMRALAVGYVESDRFFACPPSMLDALAKAGFAADAAFAVWVLQHCERPDEDIQRIRRALRPGGGLFVVNNRQRAVPMLL
ncbi:MAG TPA: class I SAM-dependent methyltransferase, partial [Stellaceae bacterium]|nr:class I SAM-dependent methyltransferase [Stellaceae bacterium]